MEENKEKKTEDKPVREEDVGMAVTAYFLFFVPLLSDSKDDPFVKFHVKQGLLIFVLVMGYNALMLFPIIGPILRYLHPYASLAMLILFVMGVLNALNSKKQGIPVIGQYAEKWFNF